MKLINIGFGNYISFDRVISILSIESSPIKRLMRLAKEKNILIDATCGRKTESVLIMDTGHVVLSALSSENIANRFYKEDKTDLETL